jgi:hypothetical protein
VTSLNPPTKKQQQKTNKKTNYYSYDMLASLMCFSVAVFHLYVYDTYKIVIAGTKGQSVLKPGRPSNARNKEIILTDVSVTLPNTELMAQNVEFGQEVEIQYVSKGDTNNNSAGRNRLEPDQENIEPSGPVRVLNFSENDEKGGQNSGIHRPKPVLPNGAYKKSKDAILEGTSKESSGDGKQQKQSAFARVVKDKKVSRDEKTFPGEKDLGNLETTKIVLINFMPVFANLLRRHSPAIMITAASLLVLCKNFNLALHSNN